MTGCLRRTGVWSRWFDTNRSRGFHRKTGDGAIFRDTGHTVHSRNRYASPRPDHGLTVRDVLQAAAHAGLAQLAAALPEEVPGLSWRVWPAPHGACCHSARNAKNRPAVKMRFGIRPPALPGAFRAARTGFFGRRTPLWPWRRIFFMLQTESCVKQWRPCGIDSASTGIPKKIAI